ncbi:MAG: TlpA disulfide reductase family protein [Actinomycetota bacterium]
MKLLRIFFCLALVLSFTAYAFGQKSKQLAENFSAATMAGQTVELESLKGKVVLITFWSTKCPICDSEIPKLNQIANSYKGKDVVFLGLTTDNPTKVESFLKMKPFNFDIIPSSFGVLLKYADRDRTGNINMGYPAYFLINQAGEIEMKDSGWDKTEKLDSQINRLLTSGK